jgi:magnesium chelatase family protein
MLAKLNTFALVGIDAVPVEVEVDNSPASLPKTIIVGLPDVTGSMQGRSCSRRLAEGAIRPA